VKPRPDFLDCMQRKWTDNPNGGRAFDGEGGQTGSTKVHPDAEDMGVDNGLSGPCEKGSGQTTPMEIEPLMEEGGQTGSTEVHADADKMGMDLSIGQ
jgi:hypothetical protein